jgi:glycerophosphoryl diester phosphodiesterase
MKQLIAITSAVLCAAFFLQGENTGAEKSERPWNVVDHVPIEKFVMQSHRGAGVLAPENTIEAFELGWKLNTYPEADIRTTKDGVIVAFHDANFKRVVKDPPPELQDKGVADVTFAELSRLDVGAWMGTDFKGRRVSRISEVFDLMRGRPDRHLYLDIKSVDLKQLADEVKSGGVGKQVILASPKPEIIQEWKTLVPESGTLLWMRGSETSLRQRIAELRANGFPGITQLQIHIHPNTEAAGAEPFTLSNAFIRQLGRELRERGILYQALPYTPDPGVYAQLLDLGLAAFSTDYPDVAWREIKAYYARKAGGR